jgi:hypothetical protein
MTTKNPSAGFRLRADLDAALARASEELGRPLEFDEAERGVHRRRRFRSRLGSPALTLANASKY